MFGANEAFNTSRIHDHVDAMLEPAPLRRVDPVGHAVGVMGTFDIAVLHHLMERRRQRSAFVVGSEFGTVILVNDEARTRPGHKQTLAWTHKPWQPLNLVDEDKVRLLRGLAGGCGCAVGEVNHETSKPLMKSLDPLPRIRAIRFILVWIKRAVRSDSLKP